MAMSKKSSFLLYKSYYNSVEQLSIEERGLLLTAIFEYQINGKVTTTLSTLCNMAFSFIKTQFEVDENKYLNIVERNRKNGAKGGRPKKDHKKPNIPMGFGSKSIENTGFFPCLEGDCKNPKPDNDNEYVNEYNNNNGMNESSACAREDEERYSNIEFDIVSHFVKKRYISSPEDFIAYNKSREWRGIGGEDIREDFERYAEKWESEERRKRGYTMFDFL